MRALEHSRPALLLALGAAVVACGGPGKDTSARASGTTTSVCRASVDEAVAVAVGDYIRKVKPKPERFLIAAGTDSALGDPGLVALQDKGPTYLFPGDPALQTQVRTQLHEKGDYTTLLVVKRAAEKQGGSASVRVAGHYIGGEDEGKAAGPWRYSFACDTSGWHIKTSSAEQSS